MRRYRIGRSETNDIVIPDASVSRNHAEAVELGSGRFALSDLGSTSGTHVWQGQSWAPAAGTEIKADTVIRFGEFRTTLMDILSEPERAALGLTPGRPAAPPAPAPPEPLSPSAASATASATATAPPRTAAPSAPAAPSAEMTAAPAPVARAASQPQTVERPPPTREAPGAPPAARPRRSAPGGKKRAMVLGLLAVSAFFAMAAGVIVVVLAFGNATGSGPVREARTATGEGPQKFLVACTTQWGIEERRCRCFLAAAGPHLQADDYDDFADLVEGHLSGDSTLMESVLQQAAEKRGAPASSRLSAAFKGVGRDCQQ